MYWKSFPFTLMWQTLNFVLFNQMMLSELAGKFIPQSEERLLAVVHALLSRCYRFSAPTTSDVPGPLKKEMLGVCKACFTAEQSNKFGDFIAEYKEQFEKDLSPESKDFPTTLSAISLKLKEWEVRMQNNVEERIPSNIKLEDESRFLREWNVLEVEMPGSYFRDLVSEK